MKNLDDILDKGFDLTDIDPDGTRYYDTKHMHHVLYDYFEVNGITVYPDGKIDANTGINCDLFEGANDLDEYHVYKLTELI